MATQKQVADHLDLSERQIRRLVKSGVLPAAKGPGGLKLDDCRLAYVRYLRGLASGQIEPAEAADTHDLDLNTQRARLAREQADRVAMENAERRGELLSAEAVRREIVADLLHPMIHLLETLPDRIELGCGLTPEQFKTMLNLIDLERERLHRELLARCGDQR